MTRTTRWRAGFTVTLTLLATLPAARSGALPRYSARYEQNCQLCHVNPGGGGMRSAYATQQLIPKEIAMSPGRPEALALLDTRIGKALTIGADMRELFALTPKDAPLGLTAPQGFFPMQADLYLAFQLDPKWLLYYNPGLGNTYEFFGLAHVLPFDGYVKAGRFLPPYGWKFDDHTMYVRNDLGFAPPFNTDGGVEAGFAFKHGDLQVALVNGNRGSTLDDDRRLAVSGNLSGRLRIGPVASLLGVAAYAHPGLTEDFNSAGLFGYLCGGDVTWVGEADLTRRQPEGGQPLSGLVTSHEFTVLLRQGVEFKSTYDFFDPDRHLKTGARSRWGAGVAVMPRPFVTAEAMYRDTHVTAGPALPGSDFGEGLFTLHLLY